MEYRDKEPIHMHRRKSSKDDGDVLVLSSETMNGSTESLGNGNGNGHLPDLSNSPQRTRVHSTPLKPDSDHQPPPLKSTSAGHNRTSFSFPRSPNGISNGTNGGPLSPLRSSFSHGRTPSYSSPFHHSPTSPLATSFSHQPNLSPTRASPMVSSASASDQISQEKPGRRHARIHSRNLSVFFPRPGTLPPSTIAEDGSQEIEYPAEAPVSTIPSAGPAVARTPLGAGFKFGAKPPPDVTNGLPPLSPLPNRTTSRRGHHHKHSLSHNFFSFLEPGSQPPPTSVNSTSPITPFASNASTQPQTPNGDFVLHASPKSPSPAVARIAAISVFVLGACLWVIGQQRGSLSSAAMGYWVVFDAFGVGLSKLLPGWLESSGMNDRHRRPYGNARVETVAYFASAIYLLFAAVYVCKESVEHVLLSAGGQAHHHHGDGDHDGEGVPFPLYWIIAASLSSMATNIYLENHQKFVNLVGHRFPPYLAMLRAVFQGKSAPALPPPVSPMTILLSTPYTAFPLLCFITILLFAIFPLEYQKMADLILAFEIAAVTGVLAYQASVTLGIVLLQTSPSRGLSGGKMESFLRAMREIERHPQVFHLPAPHIWQLTPSEQSKGSGGTTIVTMELHVKDDLSDDDVLSLTKWAYERCTAALRGSGHVEDDVEVTVGIVRG